MRLMKAACLALLASACTASSGAFANDKFTCWSPTLAQAEFTRNYWTGERRRSAIPEPELSPSGSAAPDGGRGAPQDMQATRAPIGEEPYKFGGKIFYTRAGQNRVASAQFVADDRIVITAAHAMWMNGDQASNIAFYPGYDGEQVDRYLIDAAAVLTDWTKVPKDPPSFAATALDYAALRTTEASKVGKFALRREHVASDQTFTLIGYPGRLDQGEHMYKEEPTISVVEARAYQAAPHPMYGGGASGGAWFVRNGHTFEMFSSVSNGSPDMVRGPRFTDDTVEMVDFVKGGCR